MENQDVTNKYDNQALPELVATIENIEAKEKELKAEKTGIKNEIMRRYQSETENLLKDKKEPFGVVNVVDEGYKLKIDTPKEVEWDQSELAKVAKQISDAGEDPTEYIKIEYSVSETKYKSWPQVIKDQFIRARTVKPGKTTLKIEPASEKSEKDAA